MLPTEAEKLKSISDQVMQLGQSMLYTNELILDALKNCDVCRLNEIQILPKKERYVTIDKIDNLIIQAFARYKPEARDLRKLVAFLKITNELDRIANSCNSFIRDFPRALSNQLDKNIILEYSIPLQKSSVNALSSALDIIKSHDKESVDEHYKTVVIEENTNDDLYKMIEKNLLKKINKDVYLTKEYQDIMAALRRLEKVADRALSIANLMHYAKVGGEINNI